MEEYLIHKGYFVQHNVKFRPSRDHPEYVSNQDSNHSDIDVLGIHPLREGPDRVWAVSCKSWQSGFDPATRIRNIENNELRNGRPTWKAFRELVVPKWADAFSRTVKERTGELQFTHVTAVTSLTGDASSWEGYQKFQENLPKASIKVLTFESMVDDIRDGLTTTLAGSEVGRLLQLFEASGYLNRNIG